MAVGEKEAEIEKKRLEAERVADDSAEATPAELNKEIKEVGAEEENIGKAENDIDATLHLDDTVRKEEQTSGERPREETTR